MRVLNWHARGKICSFAHYLIDDLLMAFCRLKKRLNLPAITSRPPCPPRVYKKLYNYLSSTLPAPTAAREPQTPRKSTASAPQSGRNTPKTPATAGKTPRSVRTGHARPTDVPEWIMTTIRSLLKGFNYPGAAPHIFAGVESILPLLSRMAAAAPETPSKRPHKDIDSQSAKAGHLSDTRILGLMAVIFLYVYARMQDVDISPEQYIEWREKAINTLLSLPVGLNSDFEEISSIVEELMPMAQEEGWLRMEWFLNVSPTEVVDEMEGIELNGNDTQNKMKKSQGLKTGGSDYIGLGTMMQDATDYLGYHQREDYKRWKANIMARVEAIEAAR